MYQQSSQVQRTVKTRKAAKAAKAEQESSKPRHTGKTWERTDKRQVLPLLH